MRVAVGIVGPGGDQRDPRADRAQEAGRVGGAAVVGHLEDVGAQQVRPLQQQRLRALLGVPGQQDARGTADTQHQRVRVGAGQGLSGRW